MELPVRVLSGFGRFGGQNSQSHRRQNLRLVMSQNHLLLQVLGLNDRRHQEDSIPHVDDDDVVMMMIGLLGTPFLLPREQH
jgi:hypothetical protein